MALGDELTRPIVGEDVEFPLANAPQHPLSHHIRRQALVEAMGELLALRPLEGAAHALRARAAELSNVEVLYGWKAETVGEDQTGAFAEIAPVAGGAIRTLSAP